MTDLNKPQPTAVSLARMILAARQIGEVVGEDLLAGVYVSSVGLSIDSRRDDAAYLFDADALDILTARVWRAVMRRVQQTNGYAEWTPGGILIEVDGGDDSRYFPNLPAAVAAIHKHWEENR